MQCPLRAKLKHVDKLKEPEDPNGPAARGSAIHKLAEDFLKGTIKKVPRDLSIFKDLFTEIKKKKAEAESQWAFTERWERVDWFAPNAWLRVKMDAHYLDGDTLHVIDHKTGRMKETHRLQLTLYALAGFMYLPSVTAVRASLWYLDHEQDGVHNPLVEDFLRHEHEGQLRGEWLTRTRGMLGDRTFKPRPGKHCMWCAFSKKKGGPCKY
jgi:RecB family exonuclease